MNDSADIKIAAEKLQSALRKLESALVPVVQKMGHLETAARESESFSEDRARLAAELDTAKADAQEREVAFREREAEFNVLARETQKELESVIGQVSQALAGA